MRYLNIAPVKNRQRGSDGMEDLLNSEPAWRQSMTAQINVFVNEVAQKTEDLIVAKMTEHLTAHGYDKQIEINGANLRACIEKQIPEEPELEADGYDDYGNLIYEYGYCPDCRHEFEIDCFETPDYCPDCGKHLKWPDWAK